MTGKFADHPTARISPHLVELTESVLFGDVWARPQLSPRDRSLVTVAVLMLRSRSEELRSHVRRALDNGVTREEIGELVLHMAFYGGWPVAAGSLEHVKAVFDERDATPATAGR